jgi:hypothetical protein
LNFHIKMDFPFFSVAKGVITSVFC